MDIYSNFSFGGRNSLDFGLRVEERRVYSGSPRKVELQYIPGRTGGIPQNQGYEENVEVNYNTWFRARDRTEVPALARRVRAWLLSSPGIYQELTDSTDPEYLRYALCTSEIDQEAAGGEFVRQTISFSCLPYLYLKSGMVSRTFYGSPTLYNPEAFDAKPFLKINGTGNISLIINGSAWALSNVDGYIELDCEQQRAYKGQMNCNSQISGDGFPVLRPGDNPLVLRGSGYSSIEITPKWRTK